MLFLALALALAALVSITFHRTLFKRRRSSAPARADGEDEEDAIKDPNATRPPGVWYPEKFDYPPVEPFPSFDIRTTKPTPYRPFKYGPNYNITMGIRSMKWEEWIEVDNRFPTFHDLRVRRQNEAKGDAVIVLPGAEAAVREGCLELAEYLHRRYPSVYSVIRRENNTDGWYGEGEIWKIMVDSSATVGGKTEVYDMDVDNPMAISGSLVQDEVIIMIEGDDGQHRLSAGSICTPGFYRPIHKVGMTLEQIHVSGNVPDYKEKLHGPMTRFFSKMRCDKPVLRNNYLFQIDDALVWSDRTNGPEHAYDMALKGPNPKYIDGSFDLPTPNYDPSRVGFRTERQSLRRLPKTGAIVFTVRIYLDPMGELVQEPHVPGRMASAIRSWPEQTAKYKGAHMFNPDDVLLDWLEEKHREQLESGLIDSDIGKTNYPF